MAGKSLTLLLRILADASNAQKGLGKTNDAVNDVQNTFAGLAVPAGIAFAAVSTFALGTATAASNAEQAMGGVDAVFKDNADTVNQWADDSAKATGLSSTAYREMATILGSQLKNMGTDMAALAPQTNDLIALGSDLAAQYGGNTSDAVAALSSLLRGERDPIERYGVSIKEADIAAQKAAMGLSGLTGEADKTATTQATLALLTKQTADAQGAFARESDTAAHAQQVANAEWANATTQIGTAFLPILMILSQVLGQVAVFVQQNSTLVASLAAIIGVAAGAILAINLAFKAWTAVTKAWTIVTKAAAAVQWLLNAAMTANPIGLIIVALVALAAAFVVLWNRSETFRRIVTQVFQAFLSVVQTVVNAVKGVFATLGAALSKPFATLQQAVAQVLNWIKANWQALAFILTLPFQIWYRIVKGIIDALFAVFRGFVSFVKGITDRISRFINSLPKLPDIHLPFSVAPGPGPGPAPHLLAASRAAGIPTAVGGGRQTLTLVLDREVFGRATIASVRRFDRRNGAAQLIPTWS